MNEADFLQLIEEHKRILYKIANSYCRNAGDREDLIQEMIFQIWRSGERFDEQHKFSTWMYRIALNVAISFYRKAGRTGLRVERGADVDLADPGDGGGEVQERV